MISTVRVDMSETYQREIQQSSPKTVRSIPKRKRLTQDTDECVRVMSENSSRGSNRGLNKVFGGVMSPWEYRIWYSLSSDVRTTSWNYYVHLPLTTYRYHFFMIAMKQTCQACEKPSRFILTKVVHHDAVDCLPVMDFTRIQLNTHAHCLSNHMETANRIRWWAYSLESLFSFGVVSPNPYGSVIYLLLMNHVRSIVQWLTTAMYHIGPTPKLLQ